MGLVFSDSCLSTSHPKGLEQPRGEASTSRTRGILSHGPQSATFLSGGMNMEFERFVKMWLWYLKNWLIDDYYIADIKITTHNWKDEWKEFEYHR